MNSDAAAPVPASADADADAPLPAARGPARPRLPDRQPALRVTPMPADANIHGDVFGGWIMAQVDIAGAMPAVRRANGRVATVAVTSFVFAAPVFVGDLLSFYADIVKVGRTSITVDVEVWAERNKLDADVVKVTQAQLVYVATDEQRRPRAVPPLHDDGPGLAG